MRTSSTVIRAFDKIKTYVLFTVYDRTLYMTEQDGSYVNVVLLVDITCYIRKVSHRVLSTSFSFLYNPY